MVVMRVWGTWKSILPFFCFFISYGDNSAWMGAILCRQDTWPKADLEYQGYCTTWPFWYCYVDRQLYRTWEKRKKNRKFGIFPTPDIYTCCHLPVRNVPSYLLVAICNLQLSAASKTRIKLAHELQILYFN